MHHVVHRLGFRLSRGMAVILLIIGVAVAAAFWIGPFRPLPARLHLSVNSAVMSGSQVIRLPTLARPGSAKARFPLVLAASNSGARAATPRTLNVSLPASYRLVRGMRTLQPELSPGNPLAHYRIDLNNVALPADSALYAIISDTLWLEPALPDYACTAQLDNVPQFVPPERHSATSLARVPVFYSFDGSAERQTGTFTAELDSTLLQRPPTPMPPEFPMYVREPEAPRPALGPMKKIGTRKTFCGAAEDPQQLVTEEWETATGGRYLVVSLNGTPRKQLFDLDRDSIIELEMWDPNNDGKFEAWRQARYAIPTMLLPERMALETASNDSLLNDPRWMTTFDDTASGPFRFLSDSARARRVPPVADSVRVDSAGAITPRVRVDSTGVVARIVIDTAWVRTFNNVAAGPYRFLKNPPARRAAPKVDPTRLREAPPRRGPRPLGVPVPFPRRDTGG